MKKLNQIIIVMAMTCGSLLAAPALPNQGNRQITQGSAYVKLATSPITITNQPTMMVVTRGNPSDVIVLLVWETQIGKIYQVQFKETYLQPNWNVLLTITATDTETHIWDVLAAPMRWYRVVKL